MNLVESRFNEIYKFVEENLSNQAVRRKVQMKERTNARSLSTRDTTIPI